MVLQKDTMGARIERAYWNNDRIPNKSPYEFRINMWRYAMGLNDTVDIEMRRINKEDY